MNISRGMLRGAYPLLCAAAGALTLLVLMPTPAPPSPELRVVHVSPQQMEALEPDTIMPWRERIIRPPAALEQRVTATGAGAAMLEPFIASALAAQRVAAASDSAPTIEGAKQEVSLPPVAERLAFVYASEMDPRGRGRLDLFTVTSDAAKDRLTYQACGRVSWVMTGDSALVQGSRLCWLNDALGIVGAGVLGVGIGSHDPNAVVGGLLLLSVRRMLQR